MVVSRECLLTAVVEIFGEAAQQLPCIGKSFNIKIIKLRTYVSTVQV